MNAFPVPTFVRAVFGEEPKENPRIMADPAAYVPGAATDRMLEMNTGRKLTSPNVTVPPLDSLFLCNFAQ